jgi:hypothetical protein
MPQVEKLSIFLASPSDVSTEARYVEEIVDELNRTVASDKGVTLQVVNWKKDAFPGFGQDVQSLINEQIAEMANYTLFVGIMWNRLGTPTPRGASGTVEEFHRAVEAYNQNRQPEIWFYFRQSASKLDTDEQLEQRKKVLAFKKQVQANGMPWTYQNASGFHKEFRRQMILWLNARTRQKQGRQAILHMSPHQEVVVGQISILYVEDSDVYVKKYKPMMDQHFGANHITHVITAGKTLSLLRSATKPDVLVADLFIPPGPGYVIPEAAKGLRRAGGQFDYGRDICAEALKLKIPIIALSTAPVGHPVRKPIEQARRRYGGIVYHLHKKDADAMQLVSAIHKVSSGPPEDETLTEQLKHWLEDRWPDTADVTARLTVLNEVRMALESASQPTLVAIRNGPAGQSLLTLMKHHTAESSDEQILLDQIKELLR